MRYFLFFSFLLFFACANQSDAEQLSHQINEAEIQIGQNPDAPNEEVLALLTNYEKFASLPDANPQQVVDYLMTAGEMAVRLKDYERTMGYYDMILQKFPSNAKAARALFMKGYTLETKLGRLEDAKAVYEQFLAKYPEDDFADDAAFSIKNLGKSAEDIINEFDRKKEGGD